MTHATIRLLIREQISKCLVYEHQPKLLINIVCFQEISFLEFAIAADLEANGKCSFGLAGNGFFNAHIAWIFQKRSPIIAAMNSRYS